MEVASGEHGDQMVRLVKAVQKEDQMEPSGDTKLHPLLWQRADEVRNERTTSCTHRKSDRCRLTLQFSSEEQHSK